MAMERENRPARPAAPRKRKKVCQFCVDKCEHIDYKDAAKKYHYDTSRYQLASALHTCQAAQYTYNAAVQSFETSFRTLYLQVKDYQQVLQASKTALATEKDNFAAAQKKLVSNYAALTAAGAWGLEEGFRLIGARGAAMQQAAEENPADLKAAMDELLDDPVKKSEAKRS